MPEINFDSIVGPTHNYSGLSYGNLASMSNAQQKSHPKQAALQGLAKMYALHQLGIKQAIIPPHERPFLPFLYSLGYQGKSDAILKNVWDSNPSLLMNASSSAGMWAANALTTSPSIDGRDARVHFTPANLITQLHRSFEFPFISRLFFELFNHPAHFAHHPPLPPHLDFADEGAANHTRFCQSYDKPGIQLFVYGRSGNTQFSRFPARQTLEASQAIARLHHLKPDQVIFAQQNPQAIDVGVFHNDVISVGNQHVFLYHEQSFVNTESVITQLRKKFESVCQAPFIPLQISSAQLSLEEAVKAYFFNSQLVTLPDQSMALMMPEECQQSIAVQTYLEQLLTNEKQPIKKFYYYNLKESMQNGGGPACLRLRVVLNDKEFSLMRKNLLLTDELYLKLVQWVQTYYRDSLMPADLADPALLNEMYQALDALTQLLQLGPIYAFQYQRLQHP